MINIRELIIFYKVSILTFYINFSRDYFIIMLNNLFEKYSCENDKPKRSHTKIFLDRNM